MAKQKIHPIWWLFGASAAIVIVSTLAPRVLYSPGSVESLAVADNNLKILDRYYYSLNHLKQACTEDEMSILGMVTEVAEKWKKVDKEADYLDALVTMSNVVGVGYYKPPNNCTQVYGQMMQVERQIHY